MYKKTLGLEVHAQIDTVTKLFSRALVDETSLPNQNVDFLDAGMPGTLPVPNQNAIFMAMKTALALNMIINEVSIFDRKHYFYQDLPLGYQITQFYQPIGIKGYLDCSFGRIHINRLHMECDAGKSIYKNGHTYVDLNRAGVALMEIVTDPDFENEDQVIEFLKELRSILLCLKTCKCDLEMGNFRADVNLSLSKAGEPLGTRVEIKNLNSFSAIKKAVQYEASVQEKTLLAGEEVFQETKLFDPNNNTTKTMRSKEDAWDYMYFPDPDLLPIFIEKADIEECRKNLPKLPMEIRLSLQEQGVAKEQSYTLTESMDRYQFFNKLIQKLEKGLIVKASNWVCSELIGQLSKLDLELEGFLSENEHFGDSFYKIISMFESNKITRATAKDILSKIIEEKISFDEVVNKYNLLEKVEFNLDDLITKILDESPTEIEKFRKGKVAIIMYFVGMIMKETKGQCNADEIKAKIQEALSKR